MRRVFFIFALLLVIHTATASDERSIKDLAKALTALARDVDPAEAQALSAAAHTKARSLKKEYRGFLNPEFTAFLDNIGMRNGGWGGPSAHDIGAAMQRRRCRT